MPWGYGFSSNTTYNSSGTSVYQPGRRQISAEEAYQRNRSGGGAIAVVGKAIDNVGLGPAALAIGEGIGNAGWKVEVAVAEAVGEIKSTLVPDSQAVLDEGGNWSGWLLYGVAALVGGLIFYKLTISK